MVSKWNKPRPKNIDREAVRRIVSELGGSSTKNAAGTKINARIKVAHSGTMNSPSRMRGGIGAFSLITALPDSASNSSLASATSKLNGLTTSSTVERSESMASVDE